MNDFGINFMEPVKSDVLENEEFGSGLEINGDNSMEAFNLQPDVRYDIPGVETAMVYGNPYDAGEHLDNHQGDNELGAEGDCGLVSTANILNLCGVNTNEEKVTELAVENGLCNYSPYLPPESRGGATDKQLCELLRLNGVEASTLSAQSAEGNLNSVADYVESGHGVEMGINAGHGWQNANYIGDGSANHEIVVTGTVRDAETGELKGFIVCDSGLEEEKSDSRYMSVEVLQDAYEKTPGASVIVTDEPLRKL
jgi:hypothetical protein